ncbi:unnamed protein product [Symbiodinium natans]|uniref:Uncharacterized protein n=1 Tax=Symbiodinium natans TaxID=878477 RepID=A0A812J227_9DINO|nr:unnamed protein product [Symbiodinium natans]
MGKPLQSSYAHMMSRTSSTGAMPALPSSPSAAPSQPSQASQPQHVRLPAGTLGIVSQVAIQYAVNPLKDSRMQPSPRYEVPHEASPRPARRRSAEPPLEELPLPGRGSIADLTTSVSQVLHKPSIGLKRSMHMMDGLQTLRCLGSSGEEASSRSPTLSPRSVEETADPASPVNQVSALPTAPDTTPVSVRRPKASDEGPTEEDPLLLAVLKDTQDTSQSLLVKMQRIEQAQSMVKRCHGTRHPTNLVTDRVRLVIERKAALLKQVEDRMAEFQAVQADSEQILRSIVDRGSAAPEELQGVRQFVRKFTHRGNPAEADRKNFRLFASTFKLPGQHKLLEAFQDIASEAGAWWADKAYQEAIAGAGHIQIMQLMELAVSVGADEKESMLLRARDVLLQRLRLRISAFAQDCMEKDDAAEKRAKERNQVPPLGMAATNADRIEAEVFEAVRLGMDKEDQCNWALEGKYWLCNGMRCLANSVISEAAGARGFGSHSFCLPVIDLQL